MYELAAQIFAATMARRNTSPAETVTNEVALEVARESIEFARLFARAAAADEATSV
jgi:hypothetical protein